MLRKAFAGLLVMLTVLPFTAPFPTCDLAHTSPASNHSTGSVDNGSHALPILAASGRMRARFLSQIETSVSAHHVAMPLAYVTRPATGAPRLPDRTSPAVLRI